MHKYIFTFGVIAMVSFSTQAHAGAAAVCIEKDKNRAGNYYDSEYFLRHGKSRNVDGYTALRAAKADHRKNYATSTPYCRHNGTKFQNGGYFVLVQGGRKKDHAGAHYNRWALGFGINRTAALKDAKAELRRRDWSWVESKHGYKVVDEAVFSTPRPGSSRPKATTPARRPAATSTVQTKGVALCVAVKKGTTGKIYHQAYSVKQARNGYIAEKNARADLGKRKYNGERQCQNSGVYFPSGGYWVLKERNMKNNIDGSPSTKWVIGIGSTKSAAARDANAHLSSMGATSTWYSAIREGRF